MQARRTVYELLRDIGQWGQQISRQPGCLMLYVGFAYGVL